MPVEQKARLMCSWGKGVHSQAFSLEVEGNSWLESEANRAQWNREAAKALAALCCFATPVLKMKRPTSACQCEEAPCFVLGKKNTRNADYRAAILN